MIRGVSLDTLRKCTQYQLFAMFNAMIEEDELRAKLAGFEIKEQDRVATLQDLLGFSF